MAARIRRFDSSLSLSSGMDDEDVDVVVTWILGYSISSASTMVTLLLCMGNEEEEEEGEEEALE